MNTERKTYRIEVHGTAVNVVHKDIKNLYIGVYPPNGRVRVAAPLRLDDDAVRMAVISRLGWIHRQKAKFQQQDRQSLREFATGESHFFEGRRYRLDVTERDGPPVVRLLDNSTMTMCVRPGADRNIREAVLDRWYRRHLRDRLPVLVAKWEPEMGVRVNEARIRKMKTRWGTCNPDARRIWLNLELAKKPASCLEYVVVHEMVHLIERRHNDRFRKLMDRFMPRWRNHQDELNHAPLGYADWRY